MTAYILRRLLYVLPIALGVTVLVFSLVHLAPGDPLNAVVAPDAPKEVVEQLKRDYGFDKPLPVQYFIWLGRTLTGDLGTSVATGRSVTEALRAAVPNTLVLAAGASLLGFTLGCLFGGIAGYYQGTWIDKLSTAIAITGVSIPHYWLGIVLVIVFAVELNTLPAMGMGPGGSSAWAWDIEHMKHLVLPVVTLSVIPMGIVTRTMRAAMAEILSQEFVQTLRAKGLRSYQVLAHVVKNAAPTVLAVLGLQLGYLMGGSILVETVFSWPGTGFLLNDAIFRRDIPLLQGTILVLAMFFVVLNLMVDILQSAIDPRMART
ncbi:MAG: ABC transporter permease [Ectothiorhodospiraceae bacterium]|nr:ABC transporter permease [Planctomycetota bacterium]MCP5152424.1 ABC transporter permease [Chromatiales bacterium]MCP5154272.1 ABC transporter permease [Ectothiorhodospiraceae bacterium]